MGAVANGILRANGIMLEKILLGVLQVEGLSTSAAVLLGFGLK